MPKKTLALIGCLVLITVVLFAIAIKSAQNTSAPVPTQTDQQVQVPPPSLAPTASMAHSTLELSPNPVNVEPGKQASINVNINTLDNNVTAVQLELAYDPTIITNLDVKPGPLFQNPVILINKNNVQSGRFTFAFGITPNNPTIQGAGSVAVITFTAAANANGKSAQLALLPTSLVTARGITNSVLKSQTGTLIVVGSPTTQ